MTLGIAKQLENSKGSTAHVDDRKEDSSETIKTNKDEFIKTKEINEEREEDKNNSSDQNIRKLRLEDTCVALKKQLAVNTTGAIEAGEKIMEAHEAASLIPDGSQSIKSPP